MTPTTPDEARALAQHLRHNVCAGGEECRVHDAIDSLAAQLEAAQKRWQEQEHPFDASEFRLLHSQLEAAQEVIEAGDELRLWEPGRAGWAAVFNRFTDALARYDAQKASDV